MRQRIINHFRELFPDQLILVLAGPRSKNLAVLRIETRKNFQQMRIRLPRTENHLRKPASDFTMRVKLRISHLLERLFFEIFFCLFDGDFVVFYFFQYLSCLQNISPRFRFSTLFFCTHIRYNIKRKLKPLLCQNLLFSDTANLQLSLF